MKSGVKMEIAFLPVTSAMATMTAVITVMSLAVVGSILLCMQHIICILLVPPTPNVIQMHFSFYINLLTVILCMP